eukprot:scaffold113127_cov48-Phaeocystis_antarctica.AAC.1
MATLTTPRTTGALLYLGYTYYSTGVECSPRTLTMATCTPTHYGYTYYGYTYYRRAPLPRLLLHRLHPHHGGLRRALRLG